MFSKELCFVWSSWINCWRSCSGLPWLCLLRYISHAFDLIGIIIWIVRIYVEVSNCGWSYIVFLIVCLQLVLCESLNLFSITACSDLRIWGTCHVPMGSRTLRFVWTLVSPSYVYAPVHSGQRLLCKYVSNDTMICLLSVLLMLFAYSEYHIVHVCCMFVWTHIWIPAHAHFA